MGLTHMRWFCLCLVALMAAPALAQTLRYDEDQSLPRHRSDRYGTEWHHHARRHRGGLTPQDIEPSRLGPAPTGFWYQCDAPAGYYPYIPACRTPWRIVPSRPPR